VVSADLLEDASEAAMRVRAGTSGWSYDEWKGSFYPEDMSSGRMLAYYAEHFGSVEVNNTFYRLPKPEVLAGWAEQVPEDFTFVLKASRRITHSAKLGPDAADPLAYFFSSCEAMGQKLGPILFQTPPWLAKDANVLRAFLALIPAGRKAAFEFRNHTWFDDEVFALLRGRDAAFVVADTGEEGKDPPLVPTASWGYARLRRVAYEEGALEDWARALTEPAWNELYAFFKHEDEGTGPRLAKRFMELVGSARAG
jgi:uncharacterized protein YecE (DUF72 family)